MKCKYIIYCLSTLIWVIKSINVDSQILNDSTKISYLNYYEITSLIEPKIALNDGSISEKEIKQYNRWKWFWKYRVDCNGEFDTYYKMVLEHISNSLIESRLKSGSSSFTYKWEALGPFSDPERICGSQYQSNPTGIGRFDAIWVNPNDHDEIFIGSNMGGFWHTTDGGTSWDPLTDDIMAWGVHAICVDNSDTDIMFIATGVRNPAGPNITIDHHYYGTGVFRTENGGVDWTNYLTSPSDTLYITDIIMHPDCPDTVYALSTRNVYKTTNGGTNWTALNPPLGTNTKFLDVLFKPDNPNTIYISSEFGEIYRSSDGGTTWSSNLGSGLHNTSTITKLGMSVSQTENNALYVCYRDGTNSSFSILEKSSDSASTWTQIDRESLGSYNTMEHILQVSPIDSTNLYLGSVRFYKYNFSTNSFDLKTRSQDSYSNYMHDDIRALTVIDDGAGNDIIYAGHDGGISISTDEGDTWSSINGDLCCSEFYSVSVYDTTVDYVVGGTQDCSSHILKDEDWFNTSCLYCDGGTSLFDYSNLNIIYTSCNNNIHRSDNGGASFSSSLINNLEYTNPVIQHPLGPDTIYAWNNSLWRLCKSPDRGNTFDNSTLFGPSGYGRCSAIEICESDPDILYFATAEFTVFDFDSCCLLKTSDNGANWSDISSNMGGIMDSSRISAIEINPNNTDEVWVSFGNMIDGSKVYYSDNAGSTWSNITGDLDNFPINDLEFDNDREVLFCCNDVGVFVKAGDNDWQEYGDGLPEIMCTKLDINSEREELYVSTHGRGIWKVDLKLCYDLEDDLIISSNQTWSNEITLCSNLIIQNGATLTISGTVNMSHDVDITIKNNSTLLISSGLINNANIVVESGATLTIEQNGSGLLDSNDNISIESGGLLNFNYGAAGIID